jgi:3-oxoacyl-[acyl-carrier-protein] synthase III
VAGLVGAPGAGALDVGAACTGWLSAVGQRLDLPADRVVDYVGRFANASTATLPIALTVALSEGRLAPGHRVLLAAFGGGLTWGGTVVQWSARAPAPTVDHPSVMPTV